MVWSTTTRTRVSDATAVTFSVKCFNPLKLYLRQETSPESGLLPTFFIYSRALNNNVISNGKCYCCNDTFTDVRFTLLLAKNIFKNINYFYAVRISIPLAIVCEIFIQIGYFF